jgi:hypothetical protein
MSQTIYERLHYRLELDGRFLGCAWAYSPTKLLTCAHVAATPEILFQAVRSFNKDEALPCWIERTTGTADRFKDASLLALTSGTNTFAGSEEHGIWEPDTGQTFSVFGFPYDQPTLGDFARYEIGQKLPNGWFKVEIENPKGSELREGYSGSPVWDPVISCVIGIVVGVDPKRSEKIAYVIPPSTLKEQLGEPDLRYPKFGPNLFERMSSTTNLGDREIRRAERFLSSAADSVSDPVQRYWIYACLGTLSPDLRARETLKHAAKTETEEFARHGAQQALSRFAAL